MKSSEFTRKLIESVVQDGTEEYRLTLIDTNRSEVSDPHWRSLLALFDSLDESQQRVLLNTMRQVSIDTVSTLLGVLDGTSEVGGKFEGFELTHNETGDVLVDLQDLFIEQVYG